LGRIFRPGLGSGSSGPPAHPVRNGQKPDPVDGVPGAL